MKILVRIPNWIGDAVNSIPLISNLKKEHQVEGICHVRVAPVFEGIIKCHKFSSRKELLGISLKMRRKFDVGVVVPYSFSSAFAMWLAHPGIRIGFDGDGRSFLLTHVVKRREFWRKEHILLSYLRLARPLGIEPQVMEPRVEVEGCESEFEMEKFVAMSPFANYGPAKEWPLENFIEVAKRIEKRRFQVVFLGGPGDVGKAKGLNDFVNLVGKTSLRETVCILSRARALLAIDSGLSHLGIAAGTKVLTIFLSTDPGWTAPFGERGFYIYHQIPCSPCFKRTCPLGTYDCYRTVGVDEVVEKLLAILEK